MISFYISIQFIYSALHECHLKSDYGHLKANVGRKMTAAKLNYDHKYEKSEPLK